MILCMPPVCSVCDLGGSCDDGGSLSLHIRALSRVGKEITVLTGNLVRGEQQAL